MFIIKFNKLIHNKWVWGVFATGVAVAFAGSDILVGRRSGSMDRKGGVGTLDGVPVSPQEFDAVRQQVRMESRSEDDQKRATDAEVWPRLAELRVAQRLGITVSDEEVMQVLRRDPAFAGPGGGFDPVRYETILANALGMTPVAYETVRRNQLLLAKLEMAVASAAWGVPSVADEQARGMTDRFTVRLVEVTNSFAAAEMKLSDVELESFYRERLQTYRVPERVSVRYAIFPVAKFRDKVEVAEDDMRDFYDAHTDRYQITTNGTPETLPFDEARSIVESELRNQGARELASDAAADFADLFYQSDVARAPSDFERIAVEQGYSVRTTGLFAADSQPADIDRAATFAASAFDLDPESARDTYSDAVVGRDASYVLAFHDRQAAHDPEFSNVLARVKSEAVAFARDRAFAEHVDRVRGTVGTEMAKDRTFDAVVAELGLAIGTNMTLTAVQAFQVLPAGQNLATRMTRMSVGEVSPAVFAGGKAVFLQVVDRQAGEDVQQKVVAGQMSSQLRNGIAEVVRDDWRRHTLAKMKLVTQRAMTPETTSGDDANP